jgi:hypothetical protein
MTKISELTNKAVLDGTEETVIRDGTDNWSATVDAIAARAAVSGSAAAAIHTHAISDTTGLQTALDGKAASSHSHAISDVTGLQTALDGKATSSHSHAISDVTGLQTALDDKTDTGHTHVVADVTDLQAALDDKSDVGHSHVIADTTGLQTALDGKTDVGHFHAQSDITGLVTALAGKASSTHSHAISDVTNLQTTLDGKAASSHSHAASDITSGVLGVARLGSGTASAGTILRGDGSWSTDTRAINFVYDGTPAASEIWPPFKAPFAGTIRNASPGCGAARAAATSSTVWTLYKHTGPSGAGTAIGTLTFTSGSSTPTLVLTGGVDITVTASDYFWAEWQSSQDATLSNVTCTLIIERTA